MPRIDAWSLSPMKTYPIRPPSSLARLLCLALAGLSPLFSNGAEEAARPNIIFILADDLGWGDLSCYGNTFLRTPNLDRLAEAGTLFTQFYVNGSVCSPSRSAFFTSQYPPRNRIHGHYAPPEQDAERGMPQFVDPTVPSL